MSNPLPDQELNNALQIKLKELKKVAEMIPCATIVHDLNKRKVVYMSEVGLKLLNQKKEDVLRLSNEEYHKRYFNINDAKDYMNKVLDLLERNSDETVCFFQQVKTSKTREWDWYLSSVKIFARNEENRPIATITTAQRIDPEHFFTAKAVKLLEEKEFLKKHNSKFSQLTKREIEILKLIALGKRNAEISKTLYISEHTVRTHRKNMKQKLKLKNNFGVSMYARAFDLI